MTETTATAHREYKLAADPARRGPRQMREILEFADGDRSVILIVDDRDAMDVLEALRRVYQQGREDNAAMLEAEGRLRTTGYTHDIEGAIIAVPLKTGTEGEKPDA